MVFATCAGVYAYSGAYGLNVVFRRGVSLWLSVSTTDARLSPSMRLALAEPTLAAEPGAIEWRKVAEGFEIGELPALVNGAEVDRILLARIEPDRYRFVVRNASAGNMELQDWMRGLDALLVVNGSYFSQYGAPDTPFLSERAPLGPRSYDAAHGAFVASKASTGIRDLSGIGWQDAFRGADNAMVSYPMLIGADEKSRSHSDPRWLANRSFVAQDANGRIIIGTSKDAFFTLDRLAEFLRGSPLDLKLALNLDGGPVACQGITLPGYRRDFCGDWELAVHDGELKLLTPMFGRRRWGLPVVLAVLPK